MKYTYHCALI